ncbi:MAG TPA: helix-turn-helix transcriptional regulator [Polyangiaceae bacterium LLY-WYZ-14_1]|nr:helix-turn-helix transcriptional regulator [Polyangiaceae bacterium LLY-WYZ-14_1]
MDQDHKAAAKDGGPDDRRGAAPTAAVGAAAGGDGEGERPGRPEDPAPGAPSASEGPAPSSAPPEGRRPGARSGGRGKAGRKPNNVRKLRIERMMSKAELARRANLSVLTVDRVEKGYGCRMDTKRKILEALGLSLDARVSVFGEEE